MAFILEEGCRTVSRCDVPFTLYTSHREAPGFGQLDLAPVAPPRGLAPRRSDLPFGVNSPSNLRARAARAPHRVDVIVNRDPRWRRGS